MNRYVKFLAAVFLWGVLAGGAADSASAGIIDSINPDAVPLARTEFVTAFTGIGWYYTPTFDYNLNGIFSYFEPIPNGTGGHTLTVQIQSDRPAVGGTLLGQASFAGNSFSGGQLGAEFSSPVALTAGHTYFVDFLGIGGMGTDFGQFTVAADGTHHPSAGATTRLAAFYDGSAFSNERAGTAADQMLPTGNASGIEPILFFDGSTGGTTAVTPEPSTGILMVMGFTSAGIAKFRRRRRAAKSSYAMA
jgi:hypothetical protein